MERNAKSGSSSNFQHSGLDIRGSTQRSKTETHVYIFIIRKDNNTNKRFGSRRYIPRLLLEANKRKAAYIQLQTPVHASIQAEDARVESLSRQQGLLKERTAMFHYSRLTLHSLLSIELYFNRTRRIAQLYIILDRLHKRSAKSIIQQINIMIGKLVDLLPDSVKGISTTLIPPPPPPRVPVLSASFEYIPLASLSSHSDPKTAFNVNHLCLIVCTPHAFEIWALSNYKRFQRIYWRPEAGLHMAHYVPLVPFNDNAVSTKTESVREYLNASLPILAISKQTEEYSSALGIHLYSLKNSKYFHVFRFTSELQDFVVNQHVIAAVLKGGQVKILDLKRLEQHCAIDTIFLSKEMHDLVTNEDASVEAHISVAKMIKDVGTTCDLAAHLIAYVRHDIVSPSKFNTIAKGIMGNKLIHEHSFAKETAQKLFSLGELGYQKMMNIFNTRKAMMLSKDPNEYFGSLTPTEKLKLKEEIQKLQEEEEERKTPESWGEEEIKTPTEDFAELSPTIHHKASPEMSTESANKVTVVIQRIVDSAVLCRISPPYFKGVSLVKFSPSGTLLLVANENGQQFYIYKLFPETNLRHLSSGSAKVANLVYSIFRGYTSATVSSVAFSLCEHWLIINSAKGTSHIYRLDENTRSANDPITSNSSGYDYGKVDTNAGVVTLSAFSRFKYGNSLTQGDVWPVTSILSNYPLDRLGTKKEVLLRMGAIFYKTGRSTDDSSADIPLYLSITRRGEIFSNALLTFKTGEKEIAESDPHNTFYGQKEYELLTQASKNLPHKTNYYNDKLVVETLAQFELGLESKGEKTKEFLDRNVVTIKNSNKATDTKTLEERLEKDSPPPAEEKAADHYDKYKKLQQKWLKEIETLHFSKSTPSIRICPQFTFCKWAKAEAEDEKEESEIPLALEAEDVNEKLLSKEENYVPIEKKYKPKVDLTTLMKDSFSKHQSGEEEPSDFFGNQTENPFYDPDSDKEFEQRLAKALNTSISTIKASNEPEQKSQIFQGEINVLENYKPLKRNEESTIERSEYDQLIMICTIPSEHNNASLQYSQNIILVIIITYKNQYYMSETRGESLSRCKSAGKLETKTRYLFIDLSALSLAPDVTFDVRVQYLLKQGNDTSCDTENGRRYYVEDKWEHNGQGRLRFAKFVEVNEVIQRKKNQCIVYTSH
eukprot:TRINITY_DN135118_c4_g1_i1.p1 TRINITY_DN135118_c4_g1~~TRINITY_DN135118_c4_g1_i1.p1  ORF type:complete len:1167 (+),score=56.64 TRINITY_DN135118_c4_g1_i1:1525-5025(+)